MYGVWSDSTPKVSGGLKVSEIRDVKTGDIIYDESYVSLT